MMIRQISTRQVYQSPWLSVREDEVEFPDGTRGTFSVVDKPDFALVIPWSDGGFWLVQQYRYSVASREWEFPQGGWPPGSPAGGTAAELAATELREETGFRAGRLTHLARLNAVVGYSSQRYDVFLATDLEDGEPSREPSEQDMVCAWRAEADVRAMASRGEFVDAHSLAALALFDLHRGSEVTGV